MSEQTLTGLNCPRCGGMVSVPEGQVIVTCPYCQLCSSVSAAPVMAAQAGAEPKALAQSGTPEGVPAGGLGVRRYQAPLRVQREQALGVWQKFLSGKVSVARDAARESRPTEVFLVYLPFWAAWGRGVAYAFGQQKVGSGDHTRYEAREKKVIREMSWNCPACEVGEFGVRRIAMDGCQLDPFNPDVLHNTGMVFEPVGSAEEAFESARKTFEDEVKSAAELSRVAQLFTRILKPRMGLIYYPMWVVRYVYHGRSFQVVVDGYDGQVLYGKAPGSIFFRAAALIGGMAAGAVITIDVPAFLLSSDSDSDGIFALIIGALVIGLGIMWAGFRTYRYGEHYEYHRFKLKGEGQLATIKLLEDAAGSKGEITRTLASMAQDARRQR